MPQPSSSADSDSSRNARLEQILADYLRAREAGEQVDPQLIIAAHPDLADDLRSFFRNHAAVNKLAAPLRDVLTPQDAPTVDFGSSTAAGTEHVTRVRYFGDYELIDEIARGGMGVVFRARQTSLSRTIALKMILAGQLASENDVRRFRQEAEAAANLDHPHIVPIYEVGEHEGQHYFSMKLMDGGSLAERLRGAEKVSPRAAAELLATVARAVHHAHQRGVLHRDLKPGNILLDGAGQPHVTDFGLAKRVEGEGDLTQPGAVVGTPNYMAPEQAMAEKQLTTAVDIFSLGAILYELLTGKPPFQASSPVETLLQVVSKEAPSPRSANRLVDADLATICLKCLEKEPQRRYDSAAALADDLDRWQRNEPILARRTSLLQRATKWATRHPALAALGSVVVVALTAYLILLTISNERIRQSEARTSKALDEAVAANKLAERRLYGSQVQLANAALQQRQPSQARQALAVAPPELRGWEWDYLQAGVDESVRTVPQDDTASVIRFSADGLRMATLADFRGLTVFDVATPEQPFNTSTRTGWGHSEGDSFPNVALTRDLQHAAVYLRDGLEWWSTKDDKSRRWGPRRGSINERQPFAGGVQLSADDKKLYVAAENELVCWDVDTEQVAWRMPIDSREVFAMHLAPNEKMIALGCDDDTVQVYDLDEKKRILKTEEQPNRVEYVRFTANSSNVLSVCSHDTPRLWQVSDGKQLLKPSISSGIGVALSPDGKLGAHASFWGEIAVFDQQTGKELRILRKHQYAVVAVMFSPSGDRLATAGRNKQIEVWNPHDGKHERSLMGHDSRVYALGFAPDGNSLASIDWQHQLKFWNLHQPPRPWSIPTRGGSFSKSVFLRDERTLLLAGSWYTKARERKEAFVEVWDLPTATLLRRIGPHGRAITALAVSPDEQTLYTGSDDRVVRIWSIADGSPQGVLGEPYIEQKGDHYGLGDMLSLAMHPDGKRLVASLRFGRLQCWDLEKQQLNWEHRLLIHKDEPDFSIGETEPDPLNPQARVRWLNGDQVQFAANGEQLVCYLEATGVFVQVRSAATGEVRFTSERLEPDATMAVSPDGCKLAYGAVATFFLPDNAVKPKPLVLRDLVQNRELERLAGYENITALAWSPTGDQLAVGWHTDVQRAKAQQSGIDLITWKTTTSGTERQTIRVKDHPLQTNTLAFLPDGSRLLSGGRDHTVQWWAASDGLPLLSLPLGPDDDQHVKEISVSPQGRHVLGAGGSARVIWSLPPQKGEK